MDLREYIRILKRRYGWILASFVVILSGFGWYAATSRREHFTATAKVAISIQSGDLWAQNKYSEVFPSGQPFSLITREGLLQSAAVFRIGAGFYEAAKEKGLPPHGWTWADLRLEDALDLLAKSENPKRRAMVRDVEGRPELDPRNADLKALAATLQAATRITRIADRTAIFDIEAAADAGDEAVLRANAVALAARAFSREESLGAMKGAEDHFRQRRRMAERQRDKAREELRSKLRVEADVVSLEEKQKSLIQELSTARAQERETRVRSEQIQDQIRAIHSRMHRTQTVPDAGGGLPSVTSPLLSEVEGKLLRYSQELVGFRRTRTDKHPEVLRAEEEIAFLQSQRELEIARLGKIRLSDLERESRDLTIRSRKVDEQLAAVSAELQAVSDSLLLVKPVRDEQTRAEREVQRIEDELHQLESAEVLQRGYISFHEDASDPQTHVQSGATTWPAWILLATVLGFGSAFFREILDTRVRSEYDVRRTLNLPVLGTLPELRKTDAVLLTQSAPHDPVTEIFSSLATVVRANLQEQNARIFAVLSTLPEEGKTTVSVNLSIALARKGLRVALVDADFRIPTVHKIFTLPNEKGFADLVLDTLRDAAETPIPAPAGAGGEEFAIHLGGPAPNLDDYFHDGPEAGLRILTSGILPSAQRDMIERDTLRRVLDRIAGRFDIVILDTPPVNLTSDALSVAEAVDTNLLVISSRDTERREASLAKHLLASVRAHLFGAVLNFASTQAGDYYYYYYYYGGYSRDRRPARGRPRKR